MADASYQALHRFARISARKVRPLAALVRGKPADDALDILRYQPQRGARLLEKVIRSAMSNAENRQAPNLRRLKVVEVRIDEGPIVRRMRPKARGMSAVIKKRMSHIWVALE